MLSKKYADVGCMYAETFGCKVCGCWVQVCGYVWVQSMRLLAASLRRRLGAKYAVVGCKSMDTFGCMSMPFGCMSMPFGCMSMDRLGACMRLLGACMRLLGAKSAATFGCMPDSR